MGYVWEEPFENRDAILALGPYLEATVKDAQAALKKARVTKANYNKLSGQFAPMAYWGGDSNDKVRLVEK